MTHPRSDVFQAQRNQPTTIGIDARTMFAPQPRGTGRNLRDAFALIPGLRPEWQFLLYHRTKPAIDAAEVLGMAATANVRPRYIDIPGDRFDLWLQMRLPLAAWRDRVDLLHLPANAAPARCSVPYVVTVHDLIPLCVAGELPEREQRRFQQGVERAVRGAALIITPSEATRAELLADYDIPENRIAVIPWAPDREIAAVIGDDNRRAHEIERVRYDYGLRRPWLLNFSGNSRRKNAEGVIDALARLPAEVRAGVTVLLVGCEPETFRATLIERGRRLGVSGNLRLTGFVPHEDLPGLLAGAAGLLIPSQCEGFGLPILDAFAADTPVLTSSLSSMPEVAGPAALMCDPYSPSSIADGITKLLDESIAEQLREAGRARVRQYKWEQTARLMCAAYERALDMVSTRRVTTDETPELVGVTEERGI
ncbi:MAG: glycosyltransferase family 4 protein [Phycisphaerae bacterium]|nr:glycosyltransferase family 4 protein [Phycisphaerae bacterium]